MLCGMTTGEVLQESFMKKETMESDDVEVKSAAKVTGSISNAGDTEIKKNCEQRRRK